VWFPGASRTLLSGGSHSVRWPGESALRATGATLALMAVRAGACDLGDAFGTVDRFGEGPGYDE
jgi:hypothetical protein